MGGIYSDIRRNRVVRNSVRTEKWSCAVPRLVSSLHGPMHISLLVEVALERLDAYGLALLASMATVRMR